MFWNTIILGGFALAGFSAWQIPRYHRTRWTLPYLWQRLVRPGPSRQNDIHLILCMADHYEPKAGKASREVGQARVQHWVRNYPRQFARFQDSDGRPPRYSFFFPIEEYEPEYLDALAELCRQGFGEVEIHLHHDNDCGQDLRRDLLNFKELLAQRHGLLSRHKETGELVYAFIHGNWALCNSRPDGRWCGVNEELVILRETGCYVDMTFPSAPDITQPPKVNSIYYAFDKPGQPRSHETGPAVGTIPPPENGLMLLMGPLVLDWGARKWGLFPRLENGCLQKSQPPDGRRIANWLRAGIQVPSRPDWYFVKLHAHGAPENSHETLLGKPMVEFHEELARRSRENPRFHYHYVTAREMFNLVKAAEAGFQGPVAEARDFLLVSNIQAAEPVPVVFR